MRIKEIVPATAPLYIYADRMHDFNFYTEREIIPALDSPAEVEKARSEHGSYMLVKGKHLKELSRIQPEEVLITESIGSTTWTLIALKPRGNGSKAATSK